VRELELLCCGACVANGHKRSWVGLAEAPLSRAQSVRQIAFVLSSNAAVRRSISVLQAAAMQKALVLSSNAA
jgi:hypothetical protein